MMTLPSVEQIQHWAQQLGFQQIGITGIDLAADERHLERWLALERHGEMHYMQRHGRRRSRPAELEPGTRTVISARMDYLPPAADALALLERPSRAYVSRYALGRDYHKVLRRRLQRLADHIATFVGPFGYRVFVDSARRCSRRRWRATPASAGSASTPTCSNREAGSWFFLGEIYTDLPLPDRAAAGKRPLRHLHGLHRRLPDAGHRRSLSARRPAVHLLPDDRTPGAIPEPLRPLIGNRIYGCDDCQLFCPWNKFARLTAEDDFHPRHALDDAGLIDLFEWNEQQFLDRTAGSAIRRIGHERWLRNIAVALGNAPGNDAVLNALATRQEHASPLVREHVDWALARHQRQA
jgi:epoxyqueuosine reductase